MRDTASAWDIPIVEIVGLLAAALAAAFAVRSIEGTSLHTTCRSPSRC